MRHLFLDTGEQKIKEVAQSLLDDHAVLVTVHYTFLYTNSEIEQAIKAQHKLLKNVPQKVRSTLKSIANTNPIDSFKKTNTFGRSCSGQVIAIGKKVRTVIPGDFVACVADNANHTDLVCVPQHVVVKLSNKKTMRYACICALGASAMQAIRRASLALGETVCVIGLNIVGQLIVQLAKQAGCTVIAIDQHKERLEVAQQCGADAVYNSDEDNVIQKVAYLTNHYGVDTIIITDSYRHNVVEKQIRQIIRKHGRVVIVGQMRFHLEQDVINDKEIDVLISGSYGPGFGDSLYENHGVDYPYPYVRWTEQRNMQAFISLLERGAILIDPLISKEVTLTNIETALDNVVTQKACGVIFNYQSEKTKLKKPKKPISKKSNPIRFTPAIQNTVRVGLIGAGSFIYDKLVPLFTSTKQIKLSAIVNADSGRAQHVSQAYGTVKSYVFYEELFHEDIVDAVIIASPHKFHSNQALKALQAGKAVLVENPMAINTQQLEQIKSFIQEHKSVPFCVDYNRSFAPFIIKIKKTLEKRHAQVMIQYRINAPMLVPNHWMNSEIGAGRIIGQAAHIIDLFCYLTSAKPLAVSVEGVQTIRDDIFPTDNFSVQIRFDDGSLCSLLYTTLGNKSSNSERMELFFDGKTIVLDNYVHLQGFGLPSWFNEVSTLPNKGHEELISQFLHALKSELFKSPISFERLETVAELTLIIDQLACEGGGTKTI